MLSGGNYLHGSCGPKVMFLPTPTVEELQTLDLSTLIDMLVEETVAYTKLIEREGYSYISNAYKELIINLQEVIKDKQKNNE